MEGHRIINTKDAIKYMFAGKSVVTFLNSQSGNRFTFKIKSVKNSNLFFVSVLTSPDNYSYIGTCVEGQYKHGKKSKLIKDSQSVKVCEFMLNRIKTDNLPDFLEVWHEGNCGKCGRRLTVPSSIENGLGPECIKRLSKSEKRDKFLELILS